MHSRTTLLTSQRRPWIRVGVLAATIALVYYYATILEVLVPPPSRALKERSIPPAEDPSSWKPRVGVVVAVISSGRTQERRQIWRATTLPLLHRFSKLQEGVDYVLKFIIGNSLSPDEEEAVRKENEEHGDLVTVDCVEAYVNLTCKTIEMCRYATQTYNFGLLFKVDDDTFVRFDRLLPELVKRQHETTLYEGYVLNGMTKHDDLFPRNTEYLPYSSGSAYILSSDLADIIAHPPRGLRLKRYEAEDASVGLWMGPYDVRYVDREDFNPWGGDDSCPAELDSGPVAVHYFPKEKWKDCANQIATVLAKAKV